MKKIGIDARKQLQRIWLGRLNTISVSFVFCIKTGTTTGFLARVPLLRDETGRGIRMIGTLTDVTELKTIETDLKAAKEAADIANRTKDEFLATLSHELRTPLNAILGWTQLIRMTEQESLQNDRLREGFDVIERNVRSQLRLIEDLLDVSRIITGKMRLEFQLVDFRELIQQAIKPLLPTAEAKDIRNRAVSRLRLRPSERRSRAFTTGHLELAQQCNQVR